jgi:hypothetical protein
MAKSTLYAYVEGTDLDDVAPTLDARLEALVSTHTWRSDDVWVVNQRVTPREWDLGVNLTLPTAPRKNTGWIDDAAFLATSLGSLCRETGRKFVIGIHNPKTNAAKDLFRVESDAPDLAALRTALAGGIV